MSLPHVSYSIIPDSNNRIVYRIHSLKSSIYIASHLGEVSRGAPDSCTTEKSGLKVSTEHRKEGSGKQAERQRQAIPDRRAHHRENGMLPDRGAGRGNEKQALLRGAKGSRAEVDRSEAQQVAPDQGGQSRCVACKKMSYIQKSFA